MIAKTLIEAVKQMTGEKNITENFAKEYVVNNYMEFRMFTRHEDKTAELIKEKQAKEANAKSFGTFGLRINGLKR